MMTVKVVTDSTCDLPRDLAERSGLTVIPCNIHFDDEVFKDGVDIGPDEFYRRLASSPRLPTTAQPSVGDFLQVYRSLAGEGHDVVSIHLSAKFSGTLNSAEGAKGTLASAQPSDAGNLGRIEIIDSHMTSAGMGMVALEAARMAEAGSSCDEVTAAVQSWLPLTHCYFVLDTLHYLQKGGRIGKANAFLGSLLSIKPILAIKDGEAHPVERPRTRDKARLRLMETIKGLGPLKRASVVYSTTPDEAEALKRGLGDLVPEEEVIVSRFGPVVGTYLGPGALGISVMSEP